MKHPAKKQRYDYTLLVVVLLLVGIGLILLYSTSAYNGRVKFHDSFYYLKKQGFATALGLAGMFTEDQGRSAVQPARGSRQSASLRLTGLLAR